MFFVRFYQIFLELCNKSNKSPSRIAIENNISKASVNRWKNGSTPSDAVLLKLSKYFNVSVDFLLNKEDIKKESTPEDRFMHNYNSLDEEDKETVNALVASLLNKAKYKKENVG